MSTDVLSLGPFVFDGFATPERLPAGGRQHLHIHRMPGGERVIDAMGPDDIDRAWAGTLWGQDAIGDALALDAMRRSGEALPYSNGVESRSVVILEFLYHVRKVTCVEYTILLVTADSSSSGGFGGFIGALDSLVSSDIGAAIGLLG